jgi:hypothetical protein
MVTWMKEFVIWSRVLQACANQISGKMHLHSSNRKCDVTRRQKNNAKPCVQVGESSPMKLERRAGPAALLTDAPRRSTRRQLLAKLQDPQPLAPMIPADNMSQRESYSIPESDQGDSPGHTRAVLSTACC